MENQELKNNVEKTEFKPKKHIFIKLILGIIVLILIALFCYFIGNKIVEYKENKLINNIKNIKNEEVSYVFVEINPKIALEIKDNKVLSKGCLNEDCKTIFNNIDVGNKDLKDAINILYNTSKEYGVDVSNGVSVSSTNVTVAEKITELSYVRYVEINEEVEKEYISQVLDNDEIKNQTTKEDYNQKLLETYKKDKDYDKLYTCSIINGKLGCYITEKFELELSKESYLTYLTVYPRLMKVLDKFNIEYVTKQELGQKFANGLYIGGELHYFGGKTCSGYSTISANSDETPEFIENCYDKFNVSFTEDGEFEIILKVLPITKINLVNLEYDKNDIITVE